MKRIYIVLLALTCLITCHAQEIGNGTIETYQSVDVSVNAEPSEVVVDIDGKTGNRGTMGVGLRGGLGLGTRSLFSIGMMYHYYFVERLGIYLEVDHNKSVFDYSDFDSHWIGVGCEYTVWRPCKWLYMNLSLAGNMGCDRWDCAVMDWTEKHFVGGLNGGFGLEAYPWRSFSLVVKGRQYALFGKGENYFVPDVSFGFKVNW